MIRAKREKSRKKFRKERKEKVEEFIHGNGCKTGQSKIIKSKFEIFLRSRIRIKNRLLKER